MKYGAAVLLVAGVLFAGCSASGPSGPVLTNCLSVAPPVLLFPAPGAAGIQQSGLQLYFGYPQNPGSVFAPAVLTPSAGTTITAGPYASPSPGPFPPGMAQIPNGDQAFAADVPSYASGTTYTVSVTSLSCGQTFTLGSFGT